LKLGRLDNQLDECKTGEQYPCNAIQRSSAQSKVRESDCRRGVLAGGDCRPDYGFYVTLRGGTVASNHAGKPAAMCSRNLVVVSALTLQVAQPGTTMPLWGLYTRIRKVVVSRRIVPSLFLSWHVRLFFVIRASLD
jgi:hypothetical protein